MPMRKRTPESYVKQAVKDLLNAEKIPWFPMQSGKVKSQFGGWIQMCAKGTADILAAPNCLVGSIGNVFEAGPRFLWIEAKAPGGKPTKEQLEFADAVRHRGHSWLLVEDVQVLQDWLRDAGAR